MKKIDESQSLMKIGNGQKQRMGVSKINKREEKKDRELLKWKTRTIRRIKRLDKDRKWTKIQKGSKQDKQKRGKEEQRIVEIEKENKSTNQKTW